MKVWDTVTVCGLLDRFVCSAHIVSAAWLSDRRTQTEAANRKAIILGLNVCVIELIKHQKNKSLLDWPG